MLHPAQQARLAEAPVRENRGTRQEHSYAILRIAKKWEIRQNLPMPRDVARLQNPKSKSSELTFMKKITPKQSQRLTPIRNSRVPPLRDFSSRSCLSVLGLHRRRKRWVPTRMAVYLVPTMGKVLGCW